MDSVTLMGGSFDIFERNIYPCAPLETRFAISVHISHAYNLQELLKCQLIPKKPVLLMIIYGAFGEAPGFSLFWEFDLDAVIHGVNATGLSAFDHVESRMAPLLHDIAGLVLPHDSFGSYFHAYKKTIDEDLEKRNFYKAAEILSEVWSNTVID